MIRLGVVSFLNSRPLIEGFAVGRGVQCLFDVPAALPARLERGEVDAALIPVVDVLRAAGRYEVVSDACIGSDGDTLTVRVFTSVPPEQVDTLWADPDSHTSAALARVIWREVFGRDLVLRPLPPGPLDAKRAPAVLLIGDKVVRVPRGTYTHEVDLGGVWRRHTGLPFVFAVWVRLAAGHAARGPLGARPGPPAAGESAADLGRRLSRARDRGVARAAEIAAACGPELGWPVDLATRYLTRCLNYTLDERSIEGASLFAQLCGQLGLVPPDAEISWPRATVRAGSVQR